ncbi:MULTISPECIES: aminopeptidase [Planococcus]|uniref:Aminopeptidase n=1 Tax=Planococcus faecalis TaxID=1598147 RepID=A0ABN4XIQ2_9BACL|nr:MULTISPECIES: aminopeptidase [Planococcus]AQU78645.1 aminopeptidase [Planococcus faecalis]KAA0955087.1 aminopeptidase [Planococcus sp. ANT_H30]OHX54474.1 peptidase M29 [Planococcus faecalis]
MNFHEKLEQYAELTVYVGLNVQKGQLVVINTTIDTLEFTRIVVRKAYEAGAKRVQVNYEDPVLTRTHFELAPDDTFKEYPEWSVLQRDEVVNTGGAFLWIDAEDPDLLTGIPAKRLADWQKASGTALERYRQAVGTDKVAWSIVAIPSSKWAQKVFPNLPAEQQMESLWQAIFKTVRIGEGNAVEAWKNHIALLEKRATQLNDKRYVKLQYSAPGTDLTIELPDKHIWMSGASKTPQGNPFIANMPTEEVYTVPLKHGVDGIVQNTKPLVYQGNVIDGFTLTFEKGKIVQAKAATGQELLDEMISADEGAAYLGEVALVPFHSPISDSNILFYNTLFDENASNHLAIGDSYPTCYEGARDLERNQLAAIGLNTSIVHEDFMIGSEHMNIDGITIDGSKEPIFRNGNWAF